MPATHLCRPHRCCHTYRASPRFLYHLCLHYHLCARRARAARAHTRATRLPPARAHLLRRRATRTLPLPLLPAHTRCAHATHARLAHAYTLPRTRCLPLPAHRAAHAHYNTPSTPTPPAYHHYHHHAHHLARARTRRARRPFASRTLRYALACRCRTRTYRLQQRFAHTCRTLPRRYDTCRRASSSRARRARCALRSATHTHTHTHALRTHTRAHARAHALPHTHTHAHCTHTTTHTLHGRIVRLVPLAFVTHTNPHMPQLPFHAIPPYPSHHHGFVTFTVLPCHPTPHPLPAFTCHTLPAVYLALPHTPFHAVRFAVCHHHHLHVALPLITTLRLRYAFPGHGACCARCALPSPTAPHHTTPVLTFASSPPLFAFAFGSFIWLRLRFGYSYSLVGLVTCRLFLLPSTAHRNLQRLPVPVLRAPSYLLCARRRAWLRRYAFAGRGMRMSIRGASAWRRAASLPTLYRCMIARTGGRYCRWRRRRRAFLRGRTAPRRAVGWMFCIAGVTTCWHALPELCGAALARFATGWRERCGGMLNFAALHARHDDAHVHLVHAPAYTTACRATASTLPFCRRIEHFERVRVARRQARRRRRHCARGEYLSIVDQAFGVINNDLILLSSLYMICINVCHCGVFSTVDQSQDRIDLIDDGMSLVIISTITII